MGSAGTYHWAASRSSGVARAPLSQPTLTPAEFAVMWPGLTESRPNRLARIGISLLPPMRAGLYDGLDVPAGWSIRRAR
jgi:hypothetical protein